MQMAHSNASKDIVDQNHILEAVPFESSSQADLPATEDEEPLADRSNLRVFAILAALYVSLFIAALDQLIVATSLPTISAYFDSASGYTWVGSAYLLAQAASAPIWAKLSDIWGRKPILLSAVGLFFASSIVCAASRSMTMLITGRAFQGTAAGGISVLVVIVICDLFSPRYADSYYCCHSPTLLRFLCCQTYSSALSIENAPSTSAPSNSSGAPPPAPAPSSAGCSQKNSPGASAGGSTCPSPAQPLPSCWFSSTCTTRAPASSTACAPSTGPAASASSASPSCSCSALTSAALSFLGTVPRWSA